MSPEFSDHVAPLCSPNGTCYLSNSRSSALDVQKGEASKTNPSTTSIQDILRERRCRNLTGIFIVSNLLVPAGQKMLRDKGVPA